MASGEPWVTLGALASRGAAASRGRHERSEADMMTSDIIINTKPPLVPDDTNTFRSAWPISSAA